MKKQAFALVLVVLISGLFALPKNAFTRDDGRYDRSRLQGRWYMEGDPNKATEINADRHGMEATNENGKKSRLDVDRNGNLRALDWQGVRGRVHGNRIEWDNGTTWTRRPADRYGRR
jgi:hypothetical protein